ncbi:MAG: hypothetical protein JWM98_2311 [Thermoleophilia bacterium]|nr:hypothetical protein [Thermoleophilia bacterium]
MHIAPASAATPQPPTAGLLHTVYRSWFEQLGAIDGGRPMATDELELRFETNRDAVLARAALEDAVDGVRLTVRLQDGSAPHDVAVGAGEVAGFVARIGELVKVEPRRVPSPAFVVTSERPDTNARLDHLLRDEVLGLPVAWQTAARG